MTPAAVRRRRARAGHRPTRGRSRSSRSAARGPSIAPGQFMMVYAFGIGEVPISVSGPPEPSRAGRPHGACRRRGHASDLRGGARRGARPPRARSATSGRSTTASGGDVVVRRRRDRPGAASPGRAPRARAPSATTEPSRCCTARERPPTCSTSTQLEEWGEAHRRRRDRSTRQAANGPAGSASCRSSSRGADLPTRTRRPPSSAGRRS